MAQSTAGIKVGYITGTEEPKNASTVVEFTGIKSIPNLSGSTDSIETTTFANTKNKTYIPGLNDLGGTMEFEANFTKELVQEVETAKAANETGLFICVVFPAPVDTMYFFKANIVELAPNESGVNEVLDATLRVTPLDDIKHVKASI